MTDPLPPRPAFVVAVPGVMDEMRYIAFIRDADGEWATAFFRYDDDAKRFLACCGVEWSPEEDDDLSVTIDDLLNVLLYARGQISKEECPLLLGDRAETSPAQEVEQAEEGLAS